jgi:hypothetical protein
MGPLAVTGYDVRWVCQVCGQYTETTDHDEYVTWRCPCGRTEGYAHKTKGMIDLGLDGEQPSTST